MAGSSLNDLRNLSSDIKRKQHANEENQRQVGLAHRESLSSRMQEEKRERATKMGKMASNTQKLKTVFLICLIGGFSIAGALILRIALSEEPVKGTVLLLDSELKRLDATSEDFTNATLFAKGVISKFTSDGDPETIEWAPGVTSSIRERSMKKLLEFSLDTWIINTIDYHEKYGFFTVRCSDPSGDIVILRLSEGTGYKIFLAKAY